MVNQAEDRPQDKFDQVDSIPVQILLCLVTFGIYFYYWCYKIMVRIDRLHPNSSQSWGLSVVCIIFVPFYFLYWLFNRSKLIGAASAYHHINNGDNSIINLVLGIFGLGIVAIAIMQNDLNNIIEGFNGDEADYSIFGNQN